MNLPEKLYKQMLSRGLNQQRLARLSGVSDSEVSRVLQGKSQPGLNNAFRLANALGVSLDYLADDAAEAEIPHAGGSDGPSEAERRVLDAAKLVGLDEAAVILQNIRFIGFDVAMRRLLESKPLVEGNGGGQRPVVAVAEKSSGRASAG